MKTNLNVQVDDSKSKRRKILESAKFAAEQLRNANSLKKLRERKTVKLVSLNKIMMDINSAFDELKIKDFPGFRSDTVKKELVEKVIKSENMKENVVEVVDKKEQQLLQELEEIEKKLSNL